MKSFVLTRTYKKYIKNSRNNTRSTRHSAVTSSSEFSGDSRVSGISPEEKDVQRAITLITNLDKEGHDTDAFLFPQSLLVVLEQRRIPVNKLHLKLPKKTKQGKINTTNKLHSYSRNRKQIKNQF